MMRGSFLQSTQARVCLFKPLQADEVNVKGRIMTLVYPCVAEVFNRYYSKKVFNYLNAICPNKKMSCIGNYRRNLIFFHETSRYVSCWAWYSILEGSFMIFAMTSAKVDTTTVFWVHNILAFAFIDIFHGLHTPLRMALPQISAPRQIENLSRSTTLPLEPRRYYEVAKLPKVSPSPPPSSPIAVRMPKFWRIHGLNVWQVCSLISSISSLLFHKWPKN